MRTPVTSLYNLPSVEAGIPAEAACGNLHEALLWSPGRIPDAVAIRVDALSAAEADVRELAGRCIFIQAANLADRCPSFRCPYSGVDRPGQQVALGLAEAFLVTASNYSLVGWGLAGAVQGSPSA